MNLSFDVVSPIGVTAVTNWSYLKVHDLGDQPRRIWEDAVIKFLEETKHKATNEDDKRYLQFEGTFLIRHT